VNYNRVLVCLRKESHSITARRFGFNKPSSGAKSDEHNDW
jgi:hypothetical protein